MATIRVEGVTKKYGDVTALKNLSFEVQDGEFFCILGPPGAGKTTTLRTILGLEKLDEGNIYIDNELVNRVHPSKRDIAMIFQNLALYPDKTIYNNIASPLRSMELEEEEIRERVVKITKQLKIDWMLDKLPAQLSGGERQRVAIGRAIVRQPRAYLMDEPLANLDAKLRLEMRVSLKELQATLKETFVYVTHDQIEALSMADRIAILNLGELQQLGKPDEVYRLPDTMIVAMMLGNPSMNFIDCTMEEREERIYITHEGFSVYAEKKVLGRVIGKAKKGGGSMILGVRPEDINIQFDKPKNSAAAAEIYVTEPLGSKTIVDVKTGNSVIKTIADSTFSGKPGQRVWMQIKESKLHLFEKETGLCIYHAETGSPLHLAQ